jgi:hypothetical protein
VFTKLKQSDVPPIKSLKNIIKSHKNDFPVFMVSYFGLITKPFRRGEHTVRSRSWRLGWGYTLGSLCHLFLMVIVV